MLFVLLALWAMFFVCPTGSSAAPARSKAPPKPQSPASLHFDHTCTPGRRTIIAAVGDLLFHDALQIQAYRPGASFRQFWGPVARVLAGADLAYGNLESPIAEGVKAGGGATRDPGRTLDRVVYGRKSDALIFNTHPSVASDLKASGFAIISTANNHSADRGSLGIYRTLDALAAAGLAATGTRRKAETASPAPWHTRTPANGLTVAWLACTFDLNGMPDRHNQVLQCYRDKAVVLDEIRALAVDPTVDAVIVTPHWGEENSHAPLMREKALARELVDAGATAILGAHPHVLQPWEKVVTRDGREALIVYSLGNFVSNQPGDAQRTGVIALLELTKPDHEPARLSAAGFVPTFVEMSRGHRVTELTPADKAYHQAMRLLPAGNRVVAGAMRDLPRDCKPPLPVIVASAEAHSIQSGVVAPAIDDSHSGTDHPEPATRALVLAERSPPAPAAPLPATSIHDLSFLPPPLHVAFLDAGGHSTRPAPTGAPARDCPRALVVATAEPRSSGTLRAACRRSPRLRRARTRVPPAGVRPMGLTPLLDLKTTPRSARPC